MGWRLLVADDDESLREALTLALGLEGYDCVTADDGESALRQFDREQPDAVILDVRMPKMDGFAVCERIRAESEVPILMLTAKKRLKDRVNGLNIGADDYLAKPFALEELIARVGALLRRQHRTQTRVLRYRDLRLDIKTHEVNRNEMRVDLSPPEFELLAVFLLDPGQALTPEELARRGWGEAGEGALELVREAVEGLRTKLEAGGRERLIQFVPDVGYALQRE
ncbi:MAG TPA: response regulator transcription factor [Chloroflexota bacterium]|jgi:two-component system response regulator MprA